MQNTKEDKKNTIKQYTWLSYSKHENYCIRQQQKKQK